ncbi:MAG TPA: hypothetical protein VHY37_01665 [Tepidisphaeraceae bacterium]|jgi:hypothetical protein|nr:hypothetical protein [Tepidisphaeraceae bacterium]
MNTEHESFDQVLRAAMQRRPEPAAPADLPARAMRLAAARSAAVEPARLRRVRLVARFASLAAVVLIGFFIAVGVHRLADHGDLTLTPGNNYTAASAVATQNSASSSTSTSSNSSSSLSWTIMVGMLALTGLGAAAVIRQSSPFAGAAGMGRFA